MFRQCQKEVLKQERQKSYKIQIFKVFNGKDLYFFWKYFLELSSTDYFVTKAISDLSMGQKLPI